MVSDALYDLALAFRKSKIWLKLYDTQLFAVRHADGTLGYCCVMGMNGEHLALAVYPGGAGLEAYRKMGADRSGLDAFGLNERRLSQDCVMVSFQNKRELRKCEIEEVNAYMARRALALRGSRAFPQFERFRPHVYPWLLEDAADQAHLREALEAALYVSERLTLTSPESLGFTEGAPFDRTIPLLEKEHGAFVIKSVELGPPRKERYPSPRIADEILLRKLNKCAKRSGEWACDIFMHLDPLCEGDSGSKRFEELEEAPYFPFVLFVMQAQEDIILGIEMAKEAQVEQKFSGYLANLALSVGRPTEIIVSNDRARAFFKQLAPQLGAKLTKRKTVPVLISAKASFAEQFGSAGDADDGEEAEWLKVLQDPANYADMPDEVLAFLSQAALNGKLPPDVIQLIACERRRRGL